MLPVSRKITQPLPDQVAATITDLLDTVKTITIRFVGVTKRPFSRSYRLNNTKEALYGNMLNGSHVPW